MPTTHSASGTFRRRVTLLALLAWAWLAGPAALQAGGEDDKAPDPAADVALARAVAPSLVRVEYTVQYDKGEAPRAGMVSYGRGSTGSPVSALLDERPMSVPGFLIGPRRVLTPDPLMHPRFLRGIAVRQGDRVVPAKLVAVAESHDAVFLELDKPLAGAKPLVFDAKAPGPFRAVRYRPYDADWTTMVAPLRLTVEVTDTGRRYFMTPANTLVVGAKGTPVAVVVDSQVPGDGSWKGSPADWPVLTAAQCDQRLARARALADRGLLRVALSFRSPKKRAGHESYSRGQDDDEKTERNVPGVLLDSHRVLVLAPLSPQVTARLERVQVYGDGAAAAGAEFVCSLRDYGALVVRLAKEVKGAMVLSDRPITEFRDRLLTRVEFRLQGAGRLVHYERARIQSFRRGWRDQVYANLQGRDEHSYVLDARGKLLAFPLARRPKVGMSSRYDRDSASLTPVEHILPALADLPAHSDPDNVPLPDTDENRLAWLGVILQPLNRELARFNNISEYTQDGRTGALISYVYPGSPADKAGVKVGQFLLRLHVPDKPKPIEVRLNSYEVFQRGFPWERLGDLPERLFDQIPPPWPALENSFTRALTDIGFGKKYQAEFIADGKVIRKAFTVEPTPTHYLSAKRHKDKALGLTVADMTYEVRRYFQKTPADPGVLCAKIEPGSKASVAGLKPYEVVTAVNDKPVHNVEEFAKALAGQTELRMAVKRWTRGRVVKIRLGS